MAYAQETSCAYPQTPQTDFGVKRRSPQRKCQLDALNSFLKTQNSSTLFLDACERNGEVPSEKQKSFWE